MKKKQIVLYIAIFIAAVLAMLGIAYGIHSGIRASNLADIEWYDVNAKEFVITTEKELYDLETLSQYYDFAGQTVKLGADIVVNEGSAEDWHETAPAKKWQPITEFAGTFDGQGHSISGLYGKSSSMSMGLFSETKKGFVIKDLKLLNSYFRNTTGSGLGSILGEGTGTIEKVYSNAIVYGQAESNGGIAGLITDDLVMTECWFDGTVTGERRSNGGLIGWVDKKSNVTIDNCLNSGTIRFTGTGGSKTAGLVGAVSEHAYRTNVSKLKITNSLSTGEVVVPESVGSYTGSGIGCIRNFGSVILENTYAIISMENIMAELTVGYNNGALSGNITPRFHEQLVDVGGYQWTNLDFDQYWSAVEGDMPVLKYFADSELSLAGVEKKVDTSWYQKGKTEFIIEDAADLWGFAMLSADTNFEGVTIKLAKDIVINDGDASKWGETAPEYNWFSIYSFAGTFDGQGHNISGIYSYSNQKYHGFIERTTASAKVTNLKLTNSYLRATYCVGAVIGMGGGNISNIYSDGIVVNTGEHTGGIIGALNLSGTISNCWFDGEVHGGTSYTGGITSAVMTSMGIVEHCLNTGTIYAGTKNATGGLIGLSNNKLTLRDSLNAGKIDITNGKGRVGSVIGHIMASGTPDISTTYTTRESYETSIGQGYPHSGAPFVNAEAELKGNAGYKNTALDFENYWAINKNGHPILKTFAETVPALPNIKHPTVADTSWYNADKTTFVITTAEQLYGFSQLIARDDFKGKTVKLGKDINLNTGDASTWNTQTPANQWAPIYNFAGTFDGQGHTISGLYMRDGLWRVGLFGNTVEGAVVKNVKVTNSYLEGAYHIGSIVGYVDKSTVSGVYSEAHVAASKGHLGGIAGSLGNGTVENAWFNGVVDCNVNYVGGITSFAGNGVNKLTNCLNTGTVNGANQVGGLIGRVAAETKVSYSLGTGKITAKTANVGTLFGHVVKGTKCDIAEGVYAVSGAAKNLSAGGATIGLAITYDAEALAGDSAYQRTILDFNKYWAVVADSTPVLKQFGGNAPSNMNVARVTAPDTSWYDAKKTTYTLYDYADLYGFSVLAGQTDFAGKTVKLGNDIVGNTGDAADFAENAPLNQWVPIGNFAGTFDGQDRTISGLSHNSTTNWYVGLFGSTKEGAVIKDVNFENSYFSGQYHVGSAAGSADGTTIQNVYSEAILNCSSGHGGGITGSMTNSTLDTCWYNGSLQSPSYTGGMVSNMSGDKNVIKHCLNTAPISGKSNIAGIAGRVDGTLVLKDSLNTGKITGNSHAGSIIGNIVKNSNVTVEASYGTRESAVKAVATGTYKGIAANFAEYALEDYSGSVVTDLDFDNYWVALKGDTPKLRNFAGTSNALNHKDAKIHVDTSWYKSDAKKYTLKDAGDLYGFALLVNSGTDFEGKTVELGNDITLNTGKAEDYATSAPMYKWTPIGSTANHASNTLRFSGTFDGKMHTVSGLCADDESNWFNGLFGATDGATIKNLKIENSYFAGLYYVASVVGNANETDIRTVYSDAILVNKATANSGNSGGIVGGASSVEIDDVWFDGSIESQGQFIGGIVGVSFNNCVNEFRNCLNTSTITNMRTSGNLITGGIIGGAQASFTMSQCVSASETPIAVGNNARVGSVIGYYEKDAIVNNVYATTGTYTKSSVAIAVGASANGASLSTQPEIVADLSGYNAYTYTNLDFGTYWSLVENEVTQLTSFVSGKQIALGDEALFRPDTSWVNAAADSQGNPAGSKENPYILMDRGDLYGFAELVNGGKTFQGEYVSLGDDITVNKGDSKDWAAGEKADHAWTPIGVAKEKHFMGTFDGENPLTKAMHSISGIYMAEDRIGGLFVDTDSATLKNFVLKNSYFKAEEGTAAVAGWYCGGTFDTIQVAKDVIVETYFTGKGIRNHAAGLVCLIDEAGSKVNNCWVDASISGKGYVGGIVSYITADNVEFTNCLVTGEIKATGNYVGGLIGYANKTITVKDSLVACRTKINATGANTGAITGTIGASSTVENIYATTATYSKASGANLEAKLQMVEKLSGWFGYKHTDLDFADTWYAMKDSEPRLQSFVTSGQLDTAGVLDWSKAEGTEADPYIISNEAELYSLAKLVNAGNTMAGKYIKLASDITFEEGSMWTPMGIMLKDAAQKADYSGGFQGIFDGDGHKITGMKVASNSKSVHGGKSWYLGFIGVALNATVKNLEILDSSVTGEYNSGTFVGMAENLTLQNLHTNGSVTLSKGSGGGIVGVMTTGLIENCWNEGAVTVGTYGYVGGLVANAYGTKVTIRSCLNTGTVTCGGNNAGGFIGLSTTNVEISDSLTTGKVTGNSRTGLGIGCQNGTNAMLVNWDETTVYVVKNGLSLNPLGLNYGQSIKNAAGISLNASTCMTVINTNADISGVKGYTGTNLIFDRPETPEVQEGYWVATEGTPELKSFSSSDNSELIGQFRTETKWANSPVKKTVGGVEVNTYTIDRPEELLGLASLVNASTSRNFAGEVIYLANDMIYNVNMDNATVKWAPIGTYNTKLFAGTFDGQGHTIRGLYTDLSGNSGVAKMGAGLFGYIDTTAAVRNFRLENSFFKASDYAGVVAYAKGGTIDTVYSNATINVTATGGGGIAGAMYAGTITNCHYAGNITAAGRYLGGIVGIANGIQQINSCLFTGSIQCTNGSGNVYTGGIVGVIQKGTTITDSLVTASNIQSTKTGCYGSVIGSVGDSASQSFTVTVQDVYAATNIGNTTKTVGRTTIGSTKLSGTVDAVADLVGVNGYLNTTLTFDRPETTDVVEGYWVVTDGTPELKSFSTSDNSKLNGVNR